MRFSPLGLVAALAALVTAEDVLFMSGLLAHEYSETLGDLHMTAKVVDETTWRAMTTADFAAYKAIVIADPSGSLPLSAIQFLTDTKNVWGPAIQGNIIVIG
jgi:hypothetical protein